MDNRKTFSAKDTKGIYAFMDKFTMNEYHKQHIQESLNDVKVLQQFAKDVSFVIVYQESKNGLYYEHTKIYADGYNFSFAAYKETWYFAPKQRNPRIISQPHRLAPKKELYKIPELLKKWNQKKYDLVIEYLAEWEKNIVEAETEKLVQESKRAAVVRDVETALFTKNTDNGEDQSIVHGGFATVTVLDGGSMSIKLHDYRIKDKMALIRFLGDAEKITN
jgi:hypothetical protein